MEEAKRLPFEKGSEIINGLISMGKEKDAMIFLIGLTTGLRVSDMLRVKWEDLRLPEFKIIEHKTRNTKKKARPMIVHVPSSVRNIVNRLGTYPDGSLREGIILINKQSKAMSRINVYDRITKWTAYFVNDGEKYSSHSLRKGFGYHFYKNNEHPQVALQKLCERFNHSTQQTTLRYLGLDQEETRDIIETNFNIEMDFLA